MSHLTLIYSRSHDVGSLAIRAASWWGPWAHCGIVTPHNTVIEARASTGVVETPLRAFEARASACVAVRRECPNPLAAVVFAISQKGKKYDWGAVLGIPFREPWEDPGRWFCSELVEAAFIAGGRRRFEPNVWRITPTQSFSVL
jgi:uncharacterized protein YycO